MFNPLPSDLVAEMEEVAGSISAINDDCTTSLCCLPMVSYSWPTGRFLQAKCKEAGLDDTHENLVRAAMHYELDFFKDPHGNYWIEY